MSVNPSLLGGAFLLGIYAGVTERKRSGFAYDYRSLFLFFGVYLVAVSA